MDTSADRSCKAVIVLHVNAIITQQVYVIEKTEVVWLTVKIIPLAGIANDVKMAHMGTPPSNSVEVSAVTKCL